MSVLIPAPTAAGSSGITALTGDVTASGSGSVAATTANVGGSTAANVHAAEALANAATSANTASAIVKRDGSGNFTAGTITAALAGNASTATALAATLPLSGMANLAASSIIGNNTGSPATPLALTTSQVNTLLGTVTSLTGDVTASGPGASAATIAAGSVTLAKQANLAANSIMGNNTGSPATPLALTVAQTKTLLGISTGVATFGAFSGRPAAGNSGAMFFASDAPTALWVDDGAAWRPLLFGQVVGTQPKAAASFTNFGSGSPSATLVDRNGALHYSWANATVSGSTAQGFFESLSSATAHVEAVMNPDGPIPTSNTGAVDWGVFMRESGSGKMITFTISMTNNGAPYGQEYESLQWTSATARTGTAVTPTMVTSSLPQFLKIVRSGSNMLSQYSTDGQNWTTLNTRATNTVFTTAPDQVGVIGIQWFSNDAIGFNVLHYLSGT